MHTLSLWVSEEQWTSIGSWPPQPKLKEHFVDCSATLPRAPAGSF